MLRDGDVDQLVLLERVVVVRVDEDLVAEFARARGRGLRLGLEERIVVRWGDDGDGLRSGAGRLRRAAKRQGERGERQVTIHVKLSFETDPGSPPRRSRRP